MTGQLNMASGKKIHHTRERTIPTAICYHDVDQPEKLKYPPRYRPILFGCEAVPSVSCIIRITMDSHVIWRAYTPSMCRLSTPGGESDWKINSTLSAG